MLDIHKLERRWLKYKIKLYTPYIISAFALLVLLITIAYSEKSETATEIKALVSSAPKAKNKESTIVLEPSMDFIKSFHTALPHNEPSKPIIQKNVPTIRVALPPPKVLYIPEEKSFSLNRNESKLDIESIERRFKDTSNSNLGLFIARYYYDHGDYNEAYNYALKTNTINNKIDESWIIFSKSLVKLGRAEQAKKTLRFYISESNSESARLLLDSIERGTFK